MSVFCFDIMRKAIFLMKNLIPRNSKITYQPASSPAFCISAGVEMPARKKKPFPVYPGKAVSNDYLLTYAIDLSVPL